jgi:uncharacterized protein (TIGR03905 family)
MTVLKYIPTGVCAEEIHIEIADEIVKKVTIVGGCEGNRQAIARLVEGVPVREVITRLEGISCQNNTSCPDQLAQALKTMLNNRG